MLVVDEVLPPLLPAVAGKGLRMKASAKLVIRSVSVHKSTGASIMESAQLAAAFVLSLQDSAVVFIF